MHVLTMQVLAPVDRCPQTRAAVTPPGPPRRRRGERRRPRFPLVLVSAVTCVALLGACTGDGTDDALSRPPLNPAGDQPEANTPSAALRARLTALIEEQPYLLRFATSPSGSDPSDSATARVTRNALEDNVSELAEQIDGARVGLGLPVLKQWPRLLGVPLNLDVTPVSDGEPAAGEASAAAGDLVEAFDVLPLQRDRLRGVTSDYAASLARVRRAASDTGELRGAVEEGHELAAVLSTGLTRASPLLYPAAPDTASAQLRAELTSALNSQTYLLSLAFSELRAGSGPESLTVNDALDANARRLAQVFRGPVNGDAEAVGNAWRERARAMLSLGAALVHNDVARRDAALTDLEANRRTLAGALAEADADIDAEAVAHSLEELSERTRQVAEGFATGDSDTFQRVRSAGAFGVSLARYLAVALTSHGLATG